MSEGLKKIGTFPSSVSRGAGVNINAHEFLLISDVNPWSRKVVDIDIYGIYKYSTLTKKWSEFYKYPDGISPHSSRTAIDKTRGKIFIYGFMDSKKQLAVAIIDIKSKQIKFIVDNTVSINGDTGNVVFIENKNKFEFHVFGGWERNKHIILNEEKQCFQELHEFDDVTNIFGPGCIYLKSKRSILLFGGYTGDIDFGLRVYSLDTKKWRKIINFNMFGLYHISSALTNDERHLLMQCVYDQHDKSVNHSLYILEIGDNDNEFRLRQSKNKITDYNWFKSSRYNY